MTDKEIQGIVESRYNRLNWQKLLHGIFGAKVKFFAAPTTLLVEKSIASEAVYLGDITLQDDHKIAIYEVHLSEYVNIERNRAGIRNLLCSQWRGGGFAGAFMLCYRNSESVLRFSYVSESWSFNEDGAYKKESTDALRFTYLLGEGHRSRTAVRQFIELANSGLTLKDVTKAFSVEAVSKRFFDEYKKNYEDIVEYVTGKRVVKDGSKWKTEQTGVPNKKIMAQFAVFADPEKAVRDYVKKLMGRLVFIQFLQKKGWMGVPANDAAWKNGDKDFVQNLFKNTKNKDSFIDDVLEPLFDDLNTKRENDLVSSEMVGKGIKVPYLNGGLFEKDAQDNTEFPLPKKFMEDLLEFFTQYNFTIDENDPDDAEVGVDPEMLSCIFENLLEDNKEKGAFYTPKEIVQYMCRESLIAHLCNGVKKNETKNRIRDFVLKHKADVLNGDENISEQVDDKLKDVKICDPAIGSGAFPMGLMRELYFCRSAIEGFDHAKAAEIKKHIIQQNIYGVDIEKGAVDIARLRFWLSLIVDEDTPHALPNLDFKIMQGNSLLEQYEGVDLSDITYNATKKEKVTGKILDLFDTGEVANKKVISLLKDEFFNCEDHETKHQIREALKSRIQDLLREKGFGVKLDAIKDVTATDQFFLWHTWFSEVFEQGGFDIVIGNPPHIPLQDKNGLLADIYEKKDFTVFERGGDIYSLFYEQGVRLLREKGNLCYITSCQWIRAGYGEKLRGYLASNTNPEILIDFTGVKVFDDATVDPSILLVENCKNKGATLATMTKPHGKEILPYLNQFVKQNAIPCTFVGAESWVILGNSSQKLKNKIKETGIPLNKLNVNIYRGILTGCNDAFIISSEKRNDILSTCKSDEERKRTEKLIQPVLRGRDIRKFGLKYANLYLIATLPSRCYVIEDYMSLKNYFLTFGKQRLEQSGKKYIINNEEIKARKKTNNKWFETQDSISYWEKFSKPKIIYPETTVRRSEFFYDESGILLDKTCFFISGDNLKFIQGILVSKVMEWFLERECRLLGKTTIQYSKQWMENIPVPTATPAQQKSIIDLVDKILAAKKANPQADTTDLEKQIDQLVYKLYNLTPAEIETIEKA